MRIIVHRAHTESNFPNIPLDVEASDRIDAILARIAKIVGSPVEQFSLWSDPTLCFDPRPPVFSRLEEGKILSPPVWRYLENGPTLSDYQISEGDTVQLHQQFDIVIMHPFTGNMFIKVCL